MIARAHAVCCQYHDAITCCDEFLRNVPLEDDPEKKRIHISALRIKGSVHYVLGEYVDTLRYYDEILRLDPSDRAVLNDKSLVHCALGQYDQAIECCEKLLDSDSRDTNVFNNKALIHYLKGDMHHALGQEEEAFNHHHVALRYYEQVMSIDPHNKVALTNRGYVHLLQKNIADAQNCFICALAQDSSYMLALQGLGLAAKFNRDLESATRYFQRADACMVGDPAKVIELPGFYLAHVRVLIAFGKYDQAEMMFRRTLESYPNYVPLQQARDELMKLKTARATEVQEKTPVTSGAAASHTETTVAGSDPRFFVTAANTTSNGERSQSLLEKSPPKI